MRIAVVDIGTNSTRLLVCDVEHQRVTDELERRSTVTRLGAGVDADGRLGEESMERVFKTLEGYRAAIDAHRAERSIAVLTSAVREAANGREFADRVEQRFRLTPYVLSGDEEARLTFLGATSERDPNDRTPIAVIDIGGGSTEIVIGRGREATFHVSTRAGVVRQTERYLHEDPPTEAEMERTREEVRGILLEGVPVDERNAVQHAIAVAGTATSLAAIAQHLDPYDPDKVHGYRLTRDECSKLLAHLATMPLAERRQVAGLDPARAPTIIAGVIILIEVLTLFGLGEVEVSEHDILRGAALGLDTE
jgi:exopolyphosphatase / guanosine-5'-triphosphate,3'-diphosphate pyrophosphatase